MLIDSHDENIIVNSLYVNFHTSLPESSMEHTYSPVFEPRPQVHEYAILEVSSPRLEENSNLYHVLEGDGVSPVQHHFTVFDEPRPLWEHLIHNHILFLYVSQKQ